MKDELKDQRIPIMMTPSEVAAIDTWRFANRIGSRGEAIRRLCQIGMIWDENSDRIASRTRATMEELSDAIVATVAKIGEPSDSQPEWLFDYLSASTDTMMDAVNNLEKLWHIVRLAGLPAAMLKLEGDFKSAVLESTIAKAETTMTVLQSRLDEYERRQKGEK